MSTAAPADLVSALHQRQQAEGLGDREFAAKLGVSAGTWNQVKNRKLAASVRLLRGALRAYPDLQAETLFHLRSEFDISNADSQNTGEEPAR